MKFNGPLLEAETDARAAISNFFTYFNVYPKQSHSLTGPDAYKTLCDQMMQFAKAGYNFAKEELLGEINIEILPGQSKEEFAEKLKEELKTLVSGKAQRYPKAQTINACNEIVLGKQEVCNLATGTLEVPHTACQTCGEVVNAINVDRYGYKHPDIHKNSSLGFNSANAPINPAVKCSYCQSSEPCYNGYTLGGVHCQHPHYFQSKLIPQKPEDRLHKLRRSAEITLTPISDEALKEAVKSKRETLEEYIKNHPCKGFKIHPFYSPEGDFIQVYFENVPAHTEDVAKNVALEKSINNRNRVVGVKLFRMGELGLCHLDPDQIKFLIAELESAGHGASAARRSDTMTGSILKKLDKMKSPCDECGGSGYGIYGRPGTMPCAKCNS